jgi:hypothetical protein
MTKAEKIKAIDTHCNTNGCKECYYWNKPNSWCEAELSELPEDVINDVYAELFGEEVVELPKEIVEAPQAEDVVNHPNHYTNGGMECIDEMILIFGKEAVMNFCLCNAWKYRRRALFKNGEEDINKSHWYIAKYKELSEDSDERKEHTEAV